MLEIAEADVEEPVDVSLAVRVMAATSRAGIWRLKTVDFFVSVRVTDSRTGKRYQCARALFAIRTSRSGMLYESETQLRHKGRDRVAVTIRSTPLLERLRRVVARGEVR